MSYSDEPHLVAASRRWSLKTIVLFGAVLALVGALISIPFYQKNLEAEAHDARRGPNRGALYDITLNGSPHTLELGWIAPAFSAVLTPAPAPGTTLEVSADFGREALAWNAADNRFGPGALRISPLTHRKVKLALREGKRLIWSDTLWLYGVHDTHGHSH